jgi:hypothetical protein
MSHIKILKTSPTNALTYNKTIIQMSHIKILKTTPTNALMYNKTLIQMSGIKVLKITPTCFDRQLIIIRELI